jgi:hypothetical protein
MLSSHLLDEVERTCDADRRRWPEAPRSDPAAARASCTCRPCPPGPMPTWALVAVIAGWIIGWSAIGAWKMATRDA